MDDGGMNKSKSSSGVEKTERADRVTIPVEVEQNFDGYVLLMEMLEMGNHGSVATGTGLGSDAIVLEWKGRRARIRGRDLLKVWVATWAPDDAVRM
jgi:hypothetical protein